MVTHDRELGSHAHRTVHMVDGRLLDGTIPDPDDGTRPVPPSATVETAAGDGAAARPARA
jgi:ABC-type lipoprotein export system ATPase subunit